MKKIMRLACGAFFALSLPAFAQTLPEQPLQDTIIIHLGSNNHLYVLGKPLKILTKYTRADSIKNLFLTDFEKAYPAAARADAPSVIHYLVHGSGKRRLKVGNDAYTEEPFNLEKEKQRLDLNLPKLRYAWYDLAAGIEMHCYLESSEQLTLLDAVPLTEALRKSAEDRQAIRRNYKLELSLENNQWRVAERRNRKKVEFALTPTYGLVLLGSQWGQKVGTDVSLLLASKYRTPRWRFSLGLSPYLFAEFKDGRFVNVYHPFSYDAKIAINTTNKESKIKWAGFQAGLFDDPYRDDRTVTSLHRASKVGVFFEGFGPFHYSLDFIFVKGQTVYMTTIALLF